MAQRLKPRSICNRIGLGLLAMMILWYAGNLGLELLNQRYWPQGYGTTWAMLLRNDLPLYLLGVPAFLLINRFTPSAPREKSPRLQFHAGHYLLAVVFMFGAAYTLNLATQLLLFIIQMLAPLGGGVGGDTLATMISGEPLPVFLLMVVVPAFGEEFVFRYMLHRKMGECGDRAYIFMSALCFSMFHANLAQLPYTFVAGALFAWAYLASGRLWVPISMHFLFNSVGALVAPWIIETENLLGAALVGVMVLLLIPAAIVLFCVFRKRVFSTMRPPAEPGWPYKAPRWLPAWLYKQEVKRQRQALAAWQAANPQAWPPMAPAPAWPPPAGAVYPMNTPYSARPPHYAGAVYPATVPYAARMPQPGAAPPPYGVAPYAQPYPAGAPYPAGTPQPYWQPAPYAGSYPPQAAQDAPAQPPPVATLPGIQPPPGGYVAPAQPSTLPYGVAMVPPPAARGPKQKSPLGVCVGNVGTILFLVLAGSLVVLNIYLSFFYIY